MKIVICFDNLGPYHMARMQSIAQVSDLSVVQYRSKSKEYEWLPHSSSALDIHTVKPTVVHGDVNEYEIICEIMKLVKPDVLFIPGWASNFSHMLMNWASKTGVPMVVMSDSQEIDFPRSRVKEWLKSKLVNLFSAALVAGQRHRDYLIKLGFSTRLISLGYDVVDNGYFMSSADVIRQNPQKFRLEHQLPDRYILCCARFVEKKNLNYLIDSYYIYLNNLGANNEFLDLVLVGDGPLRAQLVKRINELGLTERVHLPGFIQYAQMPTYYALADCFVLPSVTEQWGLVVNEAMAAGLPVIVSARCGCAVDLVQPHINGLVFNPHNDFELADAFKNALTDKLLLQRMGEQSRQIILDWSLEKFSDAVIRTSNLAIANSTKEKINLGKILLFFLNKISKRLPH